MRVSVYFYKTLREDSDIYYKLKEIKERHNDTYWIGTRMGFSVERLSWNEAYKVAAQIAYRVHESQDSNVVDEMRIYVQNDVGESKKIPGE